MNEYPHPKFPHGAPATPGNGGSQIMRMIQESLASGQEVDRKMLDRIVLEILIDVQSQVSEINERQDHHASVESVVELRGEVRAHDPRLKCLEDINAGERLSKLETAQLQQTAAQNAGGKWMESAFKWVAAVLGIAGFILTVINTLAKSSAPAPSVSPSQSNRYQP